MRPIKVLANANDVLHTLSGEGSLTPAEISERIDLPRPSVYRLLDGMNAVDLTEPEPDSTARLSLRWLHLADAARAAMSEWAHAPRVLAKLVERTQQTAYLSVLRGDAAVCVEWQQGRGIDILILQPGRSLPLHTGAAGRTLLAFAADPDDYLAAGNRHRFTTRTLTDEAAIRADIEATRARGYAISDEDVTAGISALGMPVTRGRQIVAALSVAGRTIEFRERFDELVEALREAVAELR